MPKKSIGASYVAEVGIAVDPKALKKLNRYLKNVELELRHFKDKMERFRGIEVKLKINRSDLQLKIKKAVDKTPGLLNNVKLGTPSIQRIRNQLSQNINNLHLKPKFYIDRIRGINKLDLKIKPKIDGPLKVKNIMVTGKIVGAAPKGKAGEGFGAIPVATMPTMPIAGAVGSVGGGSSRGGRGRGGWGGNNNRNNWLGGFGGGAFGSPLTGRGGIPAIISYGPASIAGVSGVYGMAAMERKAADINREQLMMFQAAKGNQGEADSIMEGIKGVSTSLSVLPSDVIPDFVRFYTGMRSKGMQDDALRGFESILQLATVSGASSTDIKGITRALHQIVSKGQFMSEELKQQMA